MSDNSPGQNTDPPVTPPPAAAPVYAPAQPSAYPPPSAYPAPYGAPVPYGAAAQPTPYGQPPQPAYGQPQYAQPQYPQPQYAQPQYPQGPYGQAPQGAAPVYATGPKTNVLAVISLIAAILGILWVPPVLASLAAVIMGHIALSQLKTSREGGRGMALAGVIVGWVGLGIVVIVAAFWILFFAIATSSSTGGYRA